MFYINISSIPYVNLVSRVLSLTTLYSSWLIGTGKLICLIYMDDIGMIGSKELEIQPLIVHLRSHFAFCDLDNLHYS